MKRLLNFLRFRVFGVFSGKPRADFCNIYGLDHADGRTTKIADAATSYRYLLYTSASASDADHVVICGASGTPLGSSDDQAEAGLAIAIKLFGACKGTVRVRSDGTCTDNNYVKAVASGQVGLASNGDIVCGKAIIPLNTDAATANAVIEIIPCLPGKLPF